jgi:hypothetical protein
MPESTQHPDGGVPLVADHRGVPVVQRKQGSVMWWRAEHCPDLQPTHIAFPVAQAARLIDVADPQVREVIVKHMASFSIRTAKATVAPVGSKIPSLTEAVDAIIAALQMGAPE